MFISRMRDLWTLTLDRAAATHQPYVIVQLPRWGRGKEGAGPTVNSTGLGLPLSRALAKAAGGWLALESSPLYGQGPVMVLPPASPGTSPRHAHGTSRAEVEGEVEGAAATCGAQQLVPPSPRAVGKKRGRPQGVGSTTRLWCVIKAGRVPSGAQVPAPRVPDCRDPQAGTSSDPHTTVAVPGVSASSSTHAPYSGPSSGGSGNADSVLHAGGSSRVGLTCDTSPPPDRSDFGCLTAPPLDTGTSSAVPAPASVPVLDAPGPGGEVLARVAGLRVAFVDDEEANCRLGIRMLGRLGIPRANVVILRDGASCVCGCILSGTAPLCVVCVWTGGRGCFNPLRYPFTDARFFPLYIGLLLPTIRVPQHVALRTESSVSLVLEEEALL